MPHSAVTASNIKFSTLLLNEQTCVFPSKLITHLRRVINTMDQVTFVEYIYNTIKATFQFSFSWLLPSSPFCFNCRILLLLPATSISQSFYPRWMNRICSLLITYTTTWFAVVPIAHWEWTFLHRFAGCCGEDSPILFSVAVWGV